MSLISVILLSAIGFAGLFLLARRAGVVVPVTVGYLVHLAAALVTFVVVGLFSPDAILYDKLAWEGTGPKEPLPFGKEGWAVLLGFLYRTFGHSPAIGLVLNVIAMSLTVIVLARAAGLIRLPVMRSAWLLALLPPAILWSGLLLRESFTWLFMAISVLGFAGLCVRRRYVLDLVLVAVGLAGLLQFRGTAALIVALAGAVAVVIVRRQYLLAATGGVAAVLVILSPLGAPVRDILSQYSITRIIASRIKLTVDADTAFPVDNVLDSAAHVLLGPAPWEWAVVGPVLAADGLIWLAVLILAYRGWVSLSNKRLALVLLVPTVLLMLSLILTSGNYGTMQRLRVQPELLLLPLAAAGLVRSRRERALIEPALLLDRT